MTRILLAAGVAALAISVPATARPGGGHGGGGSEAAVMHGGGGGGHQAQGTAPRMQRAQQAPRMQQPRMQQQHFAAAERQQGHANRGGQARMVERQQSHANRGGQARMAERQQVRANRGQARMAERQQVRANRGQARMAERQQMRVQHGKQADNRMAVRQQAQNNRMAAAQNRMIDRQQLRTDRMANRGLERQVAGNAMGYGAGGCPPGLANKGCMPPGLARQREMQSMRVADLDAFRASRINALTPRFQMLAPSRMVEYVGQPLSALSAAVPLSILPQSMNYLYPATPDYYYRYGDGYLYQVDRGSNLIASLLPLLAGGYLPGQYLPASYMGSYAPDYYGLSSFYPASYGYGGLCNRYANGVVYEVDCGSGMISNVVPIYANGYGVGQMLPASYAYYNVPYQYRSMYYDTPDYNYWYAPGAIYQYDPSSSLITSVAALLSPGFTVGQPLPAGYGMYNVPLDYRSTYYDSPTAWYRYNNGYIYQVDPTTQLVSAIVASILT